MQLSFISQRVKPILLSSAIIATPVLSFAYSDIDRCSKISRIGGVIDAQSYIEKTEYNNFYIIAEIQFREYLNKWEKETRFSSSAYDIIENQYFKKIISMKEIAVPFIVEELKIKPSLLVWALNFIFDSKITDNPNVTVDEASKLWVKQLTK